MASQATLKRKECSRQMSNGSTSSNSFKKANVLDSRWQATTSTKIVPEKNTNIFTTSKEAKNSQCSNWSPLSDGIVTISSSSKVNEEMVKKRVDEYIDSVLYGKGKSRLPVFEELCRE